MTFSVFFWNPSRIVYTIPFIELDIYWYSLFFALGILGGYLISLWAFRRGKTPEEKQAISAWYEKYLPWAFIGIVAGARLGHVLFYEPEYYLQHLTEVFMLRKGGLSSHGGVCGFLIASWLFLKKHPIFSWNNFLDKMFLGSAWLATCIRIGNFFNQEIIGYETTSPFGVVFKTPMDFIQNPDLPHHPVQLYEAGVYLCLFFLMLWLTIKKQTLRPGQIAGIYLVLLFLARIGLETIKLPQSVFDINSYFQMGQILSIPFLMYGIFLIFCPQEK